jgi:hypothetical protein
MRCAVAERRLKPPPGQDRLQPERLANGLMRFDGRSADEINEIKRSPIMGSASLKRRLSDAYPLGFGIRDSWRKSTRGLRAAGAIPFC